MCVCVEGKGMIDMLGEFPFNHRMSENKFSVLKSDYRKVFDFSKFSFITIGHRLT